MAENKPDVFEEEEKRLAAEAEKRKKEEATAEKIQLFLLWLFLHCISIIGPVDQF